MCESAIADETVMIFMQNKPIKLNLKNPNQLISHLNNNVHFPPNCISYWLYKVIHFYLTTESEPKSLLAKLQSL